MSDQKDVAFYQKSLKKTKPKSDKKRNSSRINTNTGLEIVDAARKLNELRKEKQQKNKKKV